MPDELSIEEMVKILAQSDRVESEQIGEGGSPSSLWQTYNALRRRLSDEDVLKFLKHPSPIIRLYMAWDIAERRPKHLESTYALLSDPTPVVLITGCERIPMTIAEGVLFAWRDSPAPEAKALLQRASIDKAAGSSVHKRVETIKETQHQ